MACYGCLQQVNGALYRRPVGGPHHFRRFLGGVLSGCRPAVSAVPTSAVAAASACGDSFDR